LDIAVAALVAAAEEDTATGGPDLKRGIFPSVVIVDADGYRTIDEELIAASARAAMDASA
jgi:proteasome beta subunit